MRAWPKRILVAADGGSSSAAAILAARAISRRSDAAMVMAVTYRPAIPVPPSPQRPGFDRCEPHDRKQAAKLLRAVRRQRMVYLADRRERAAWTLRQETGDPGAAILRVAQEFGAELLVVGIGHRLPVDRRRGGRTALAVARYAPVPMYAAAQGCHEPTRCVVAFPGGTLHTGTLRTAIDCLAPDARVWIVLPKSSPAVGATVDAAPARELLTRACGAHVADRFTDDRLVRVDVEGDILAGLLRVADDVDAQLIAVPNAGAPGAVRAFLPNLAEPLLLGARCSVLVVPDPIGAGV